MAKKSKFWKFAGENLKSDQAYYDWLMEVEPEGEFSPSYYYAYTLPYKSDRVLRKKDWNERDSAIFNAIKHEDASESDTRRAQRRLVELGYLEPHRVDGYRGKYTDKAINRWRANTYDSWNRHWYDMTLDEDIFDVRSNKYEPVPYRDKFGNFTGE